MKQRLQWLTLLHLTIALFTVLRAQAASLWALAACAAVVGGTSFFPQRFRFVGLDKKKIRTAIIALFVGGTVLRGYQTGELIAPGVDLLLMLVVERCLFRERLREQVQLLLLGSMLMVIAGVVHVGPDYPLLLAGFVLTAMVHLGVWNLEREAERIGARAQYALAKHAQSFTRQLFLQNMRLGLGVLSVALVVFLFFPRIGAGVFFRGNRALSAQAGFSDEVALGHRGDVADNQEIVARVYPQTPRFHGRSTLDLYFRVSAFDHYQAGRWRHSSKVKKTRLRSSMHRYYLPYAGGARGPDWSFLRTKADGSARLNQIPGWRRSSEVIQLRLLQNDLATRHLLVPSPGALVEWLPRGALERRTRLSGEQDGQIKAVGPASGSMQFRVYARGALPSAKELRAVGRPNYPVGDPYLRLPETLGSEFDQFSRDLVQDPASMAQYDLVQAMIETLGQYRYTTQAQIPSAGYAQSDPVEAFLLDTKAGHCEYFASALALLARSHGMPARVVNGYYGAHKNPVDGTFQISQSQAHAWVEIYFSTLGWVRFDATPQQERLLSLTKDSWLLRVRSLFQAVETKYLEYVVDYDGKKQWSAVKGLGRSGRSMSRDRLGILVGGLVVGAGLFMLCIRRSSQGATQDKIQVAQLRIRHRLVRQGLEIGLQENAMSWARRAQRAGLDSSGRLCEVIEESEVLRFAKRLPTSEQLTCILARLKSFEQGADS